MADCQKHYKCDTPADFTPLAAPTLGILAVIIAVVGGMIAGPIAGGVGAALWIAGVFDLCRFLSGGKLICWENDVCAIGRVARVTPVGSDKSGLEKMDDDFTFDIVLSPHASTETCSDLANDPNQGRFVLRNATLDGPDLASENLGYVGESVPFEDIPHRTEVLHCEVKGCRVHDVCIVLKIMSFPTAAGLVVCSVPVVGWLACLVTMLVLLIVTAIIAGIVWAATHNGDIHDVMDPASGTLNAADPKTGKGGDIVLVLGDWVYDAGHAGWNEIHPLRHVQKIDVDARFNGDNPADAALVQAFKDEVLDPMCAEVRTSRDPLVVEEQGKPENSWEIHPTIDGCVRGDEPADHEVPR